jgi:MFS family permease
VCLATALTGTVGGLLSLFAARLALGFGEGAALPTATHAMSSWTPAARWGFAQGITHSFARLGKFRNACDRRHVDCVRVMARVVLYPRRTEPCLDGGVVLVFRDSPADHPAVTSADLSELRPRTREETRTIPWLALVRRMWPCTAVNFCYGWTLWLFLTWIPSFFVQNYHLALGSSALYASGVFFGGVVGDTLGGILSDRILRRSGNIVLARRGVIIAGFLGACLFLIPVMLVHDVLSRRHRFRWRSFARS